MKVLNIQLFKKSSFRNYNNRFQFWNLWNILFFLLMIDNRDLSDLHNFIVNLNDYKDFKEASFPLAIQYNQSKSMKDAQNKLYDVTTSIKKFRHNGPAVYLYFLFLKKMCLMFAFFSVLSLPSLANNFRGQGLQYEAGLIDSNVEFKLTQFLMRFSLANENKLLEHDFCTYIILVWTDFLIVILLLLVIIYWEVELEYSTQVALAERGLPSYYTIMVQNLPLRYTQRSIIEYFTQYGSVVDVSTIRKISGIHKAMIKIQKILDKLLKQQDSQKMYKLFTKLIDQYHDLRNMYKRLQGSKSLAAFVSFDQMKNRNYVLDLAQHEQFQYQGQKLKISICNIQPANIIWDNFHIDQKKHNRRSFLLWILIILIFIGGMVLLFFVRVKGKVGSGLQIQTGQVNYTFDQIVQLKNLKITDSFCYSQGFKGFLKSQIRNLCSSFYKRYTRHLIILFKGSVIIVILNQVLNIVFSYLADYRRHSTVTARNVFLIISRSLTLFLTNVLLVLFLECQIGGLAPRQLFEWIFGIKRQHELYKQFSRKWYLDIGAQIIVTYIMSVILFPILYFIFNCLRKLFRYLHARCQKRQGDMNKAYIDPEFDFNSQYCDILSAIFSCLTFSSGLPILYPLCCLSLLIIFWTSKVTLLKLCRQPHPSDHTLNEMIARILPVSLFIHSFMSRYFFTSKQLFPQSSNMPIIAMALTILFTSVYFKYRKDILFTMRRYKSGNSNESIIFEEDKSLTRLLKNQKKFLYSYRMQDNPEYQNIFYIMTLLDCLEKRKRQQMDGKAKSQNVLPKIHEQLETQSIIIDTLSNRRLRIHQSYQDDVQSDY